MATSELRELRVIKQISAKDMIAVIQEFHPNFDKTMQSKCENEDKYGVCLRPKVINTLYDRFAPELREELKRKKDQHRLTCRISCRLVDSDYTALKKLIANDGFKNMQNWLTFMVRKYITENNFEITEKEQQNENR